MDNKGLLKTGEILKRSGITRQMLYQYVTLGLVEEVVQKPTGQRLFHESAITRIRLIQLLKNRYPLREIKGPARPTPPPGPCSICSNAASGSA